MPPQRNLAFDIGVTIGTIGRAYHLVRERGLVTGEVGRGTYVLDKADMPPAEQADPMTAALAGTRPIKAPPGKLRFDSTAAPDIGQGMSLEKLLVDISREHPADIASYARDFPADWFEAGSRWLAKGSFQAAAGSHRPDPRRPCRRGRRHRGRHRSGRQDRFREHHLFADQPQRRPDRPPHDPAAHRRATASIPKISSASAPSSTRSSPS